MKRFVFCMMLLCLLPRPGAAADDMKPYPAADSGFRRMVFRVPVLEDETGHMVEVMVGKTIPVDCNQARFAGSLDQATVQGWGYPYYRVQRVSGPISTMMACPEDEPAKDAFVQVRGDGFMLRYNSKLPVVVYVPEEFEVKYRVWSAGPQTRKASVE